MQQKFKMGPYKNMNFDDVSKVYKEYGFEIKSQKGGHVKIYKPCYLNSEFTIPKINRKDSYSRKFLHDLFLHLEQFKTV